MNIYETIIIFKNQKDVMKTVNRYEEIIHNFSGKPIKVDILGDKALAYAIKEHTRGYYITYLYRAEPDKVVELEAMLRKDDGVLKYLTMKHNNGDGDYADQLDQLAEKSEQKPVDAWDVIFGRAIYERKDVI